VQALGVEVFLVIEVAISLHYVLYLVESTFFFFRSPLGRFAGLRCANPAYGFLSFPTRSGIQERERRPSGYPLSRV
jgi:hypothetical protein